MVDDLATVKPKYRYNAAIGYKQYIDLGWWSRAVLRPQMRSSYSTSSSLIMTMSNNEAIVDTRDWYNDGTYHWISCKGWKSSTGSIVNGWAVANTQDNIIYYIRPTLKPTAKYALSIWASDADNTYLEDLPAGSVINSLSGGDMPSYGNMAYAQVSSWTDPQGKTVL